jgi:beta-lactamase superfamily II metal-dependent hydrolase
VSALWAVAATLVVLYWLACGHRRAKLAWAMTAAVALWGGAEMWLAGGLPARAAVRIDALAVGDGSCQILRSGREALLWDCGSLNPGVGRMLVPRAARALGACRIGTALVTHPNIDHFNGILDVAEPLRIRRVLVGEAFVQHAQQHPRSPEALMLSELERRGIEVRVVWAGQRISIGDAEIEFLSPAKGAAWPEDNNMSLVGLVSVTGRPAALLCGDIQGDAMDFVNRTRPGLRVPIMEAPHHGSAREPAYGFVQGLAPRVVLQSTGPSRANDSRWDEVRHGRVWWCTALDGAAWAELERDGTVRSGAFRR